MRNILAHPDGVWVPGGSHRFQARIEVLYDEETIEVVKFHTSRYPGHGKFWGWDPEHDDLETADSSPMLKINHMFHMRALVFLCSIEARQLFTLARIAHKSVSYHTL